MAKARAPRSVAGPAAARGEVARGAERLGVDEPAAAADAPLVGERAGRDPLAHGGASEHQRLEREQAGVGGHIDVERAVEPSAVEEDRLLRQPVERRAGPEVEPGLDPCRAADER